LSVDLLIRGGTVFYGTPRRPVRADLAIQGSSIVAVGDDAQRAGAREVLDVDGLAVAPGFIDMHSHADFTLPTFPEAVNSISQGVTTEVVGNCGFSPAPVSSNPSRARELHNWYVHVEPDVAGEWRSFGEFMNFLDRRAPPVNVIPLVGHGTLRMYAMGLDQRPATPGEIVGMRTALAEALRDGAWGMSSGLVYPPGASADTRELIELAHELRLHQAMYASHVRSEAAEVVDAIEEALGWGMCDADMRAALTYPWTTIGSDQAGVLSADSRVHPRSYGAFARVLGWAVREADLFSLGEAVYKMTGLAADALGLADRGRIAPGLAADIVVFDPRAVADHATFDDPTRPATGIEFVLVNGQLAIAQGKVTGRRSGKVLRKSPRDRGDSQCQK